jgi:hypothetical protein
VDGTRVGASIGTSALIASILHIDSRSPNRDLAEKLDLKLLMLLVLVPFIAVDVGGELRLPYQMLFNLLFNSA